MESLRRDPTARKILVRCPLWPALPHEGGYPDVMGQHVGATELAPRSMFRPSGSIVVRGVENLLDPAVVLDGEPRSLGRPAVRQAFGKGRFDRVDEVDLSASSRYVPHECRAAIRGIVVVDGHVPASSAVSEHAIGPGIPAVQRDVVGRGRPQFVGPGVVK